MKAAQITKYGGKEAITINANVTKPEITAGKVLIEVHAAGVNPFDWKVRAGYMEKIMPPLPFTLGGDLSGVVTEVGAGVADFKPGDEVYGQANVLNGGSGAFAQFDLAKPGTIALKPKNLSHNEAGAIPLTGVSAYQGLVEHANLTQGQKILIHGGAGGIGTAAIQLAKHLGAYVATTVDSDDIEFVTNLGADEVIDYTKKKFEDALSDFDAVFDTVGGDTYKRSFQVLKRGGIVVSMLEQPDEKLMESQGVKAIGQATKVNTERLSKLRELLDRQVISVQIDEVFALEEAAAALERLEKGHPEGKIVIEIK
jgi:alcohol dehydrogenase